MRDLAIDGDASVPRADRLCTSSSKSGLVKGCLEPAAMTAVVVKLGRQTDYAECFVRDGSDDLAVHATATFPMIAEAAPTK
jgi:hypothetical protein